MKPVPIDFHIGPLLVHTYGIGLAITFLFGYFYLRRRLRDHGYPDGWVDRFFVWVIVAAVLGARVVHVIANISFYLAQPAQIPQIWHGGLSSWGGLAFGIPTGFFLARRYCPELSARRGADLVAPVLLASWAIGRVLGPQFMISGGGHPTHLWLGMYYAGQVGKRLPVPIFQSLITVGELLIVWWVERHASRLGGPAGIVAAVAAGLWGLGRFFEEHLWLAYPGHVGAIAVQAAGLALAVTGFTLAGTMAVRWLRSRGSGGPAARAYGGAAGPCG